MSWNLIYELPLSAFYIHPTADAKIVNNTLGLQFSFMYLSWSVKFNLILLLVLNKVYFTN